MITVTKRLEFDAAHRLLGDPGKCGNLHGHRFVAEVTVSGEYLDEQGRLVDFSEVKGKVGRWIDDHLDHSTIVDVADKYLIGVLGQMGSKCYVVDGPPSTEIIARTIFEAARSAGFIVVSVELWETPSNSARVTSDLAEP